VVAFCQEWADKRQTLDFDTDGVVVKVDQLALRSGSGDGEIPRWATAFNSLRSRRRRFSRASPSTLGRTGAVTPFALLEPVRLAESTISMRPPQRRGRGPKRPADGRLRPHREGWRRDPESGEGHTFHPAAAAVGACLRTCPECGSTLRRDEEEVVCRCRMNRVPAESSSGGLEHFASRSAHEHRRARRVADRAI